MKNKKQDKDKLSNHPFSYAGNIKAVLEHKLNEKQCIYCDDVSSAHNQTTWQKPAFIANRCVYNNHASNNFHILHLCGFSSLGFKPILVFHKSQEGMQLAELNQRQEFSPLSLSSPPSHGGKAMAARTCCWRNNSSFGSCSKRPQEAQALPQPFALSPR